MKEPIVFFMIEYETKWYIEKIGPIKQKPLTSDFSSGWWRTRKNCLDSPNMPDDSSNSYALWLAKLGTRASERLS